MRSILLAVAGTVLATALLSQAPLQAQLSTSSLGGSSLGISPSGPSKLAREPGSSYLEDFLDQKVKVPLQKETTIYYDLEMSRVLGVLRANQQVELVAIAPNMARVRGQARQGQVAGWISQDAVSLEPTFVENLRKAAERHAMVSELISRNEVAVGMTADEVGRSLGKPQKKFSRMDNEGRQDVWEFIRYETVPQQQPGYDRFGRLVNTTIYVKVPVGKLSVALKDGLVDSIEASEGDPVPGAGVKIVVPPINVW